LGFSAAYGLESPGDADGGGGLARIDPDCGDTEIGMGLRFGQAGGGAVEMDGEAEFGRSAVGQAEDAEAAHFHQTVEMRGWTHTIAIEFELVVTDEFEATIDQLEQQIRFAGTRGTEQHHRIIAERSAGTVKSHRIRIVASFGMKQKGEMAHNSPNLYDFVRC